MRKLAVPLLVITSILLAVSVGMHLSRPGSSENSTAATANPPPVSQPYRPALEHDPPVPEPPASMTADFTTFLGRLREASENSASSLVLERDARERAEQVFRSSTGVPDDIRIEMHSPFFEVDPEGKIVW